MNSEQIPRASIDASRHGFIDFELKSLKLYSRRLQSVLTIHATELQVLQRLYYKNKNQHRGALFWRNVTEIRRFLEKLDKLNLLDRINGLRSTFYDTTQNVNTSKGSWTHFPTEKTLNKFSDHFQSAVKLGEKMFERCITAYRSFHRSLQSAAFLQILLMFVAITSRTGALATELNDILKQIISCTNRLISIMTIQQDVKTKSPHLTSIPAEQPMELHDAESLVSSIKYPISMQHVASTSAPLFSPTKQSRAPSPAVILEKTVIYKTRTESKQPPDAAPLSKKKKRKVPRNEIDDIFGF